MGRAFRSLDGILLWRDGAVNRGCLRRSAVIASIDDASLRTIAISTADSRESVRWVTRTTSWSDLVAKLKTPQRLQITAARFKALPQGERHALKDAGGYIAGKCHNGRRKAADVREIQLVRLDADAAPVDWQEAFAKNLDGLVWFAHTTASHQPDAPRVRVVLPLSRAVTPEEYSYISRRIAERIDPDAFPDATTFRHNQMMFWPAVPSDAEYVAVEGTGRVFDVDALLASAPDWQDVSTWPFPPEGGIHAAGSRQQDPLEKKGWIGAFCRTSDIYKAIETFLPGTYAPGSSPDRFSYAKGSLRNGLVIYEGGRWAFSHHALSDPAAGKLLNSWDLVRIHLYGELDRKVGPDVATARFPSSLKMKELAQSDDAVRRIVAVERIATADDFDVVDPGGDKEQPTEDDSAWMERLDFDSDAAPKATPANLNLILRHDSRLTDILRYNTMTHAVEITEKWPVAVGRHGGPESARVAVQKKKKRSRPATMLDDDHVAALQNALSVLWKQNWAFEVVFRSARLVAKDDSFCPIVDILDGLKWDGVARIDSWLSDYCEVEPSEYTRQVGRKFLIAAVARVREPGCKFDYMLLLHGEQGTRKSTTCMVLALEPRFYAELRTVDPKMAAEAVCGKWIVEMSELDAMNRGETTSLKAFVTSPADRLRPAYGRSTEEWLRTCVVIGTTNEVEVLRDTTGNRRFWPVHTGHIDTDGLKAVVPQLYAEADVAFMLGENLYLEGEAAEIALGEQEAHRQVDPWEDTISVWLEKPIPEDWYDRPGEYVQLTEKMVERTKVCVQEILTACLDIPVGRQTATDRRRVGSIMRRFSAWSRPNEPVAVLRFGKRYDRQRGWQKIPF